MLGRYEPHHWTSTIGLVMLSEKSSAAKVPLKLPAEGLKEAVLSSSCPGNWEFGFVSRSPSGNCWNFSTSPGSGPAKRTIRCRERLKVQLL